MSHAGHFAKLDTGDLSALLTLAGISFRHRSESQLRPAASQHSQDRRTSAKGRERRRGVGIGRTFTAFAQVAPEPIQDVVMSQMRRSTSN